MFTIQFQDVFLTLKKDPVSNQQSFSIPPKPPAPGTHKPTSCPHGCACFGHPTHRASMLPPLHGQITFQCVENGVCPVDAWGGGGLSKELNGDPGCGRCLPLCPLPLEHQVWGGGSFCPQELRTQACLYNARPDGKTSSCPQKPQSDRGDMGMPSRPPSPIGGHDPAL